MNLDEMERLAGSIANDPLVWRRDNNTLPTLARFVLAVLPVVRAAERYCDRIDTEPDNKAGLVMDGARLKLAIDSLRRARDGESDR